MMLDGEGRKQVSNADHYGCARLQAGLHCHVLVWRPIADVADDLDPVLPRQPCRGVHETKGKLPEGTIVAGPCPNTKYSYYHPPGPK